MLDKLFGGSGNRIQSVNVNELAERLKDTAHPAVLIDVREVWEFTRGHARGAKNIPLGEVMRRIKEIPQDTDVYIICQSGNRSMTAARALLQSGLTRVFNVSGGTGMWMMHHLPLG